MEETGFATSASVEPWEVAPPRWVVLACARASSPLVADTTCGVLLGALAYLGALQSPRVIVACGGATLPKSVSSSRTCRNGWTISLGRAGGECDRVRTAANP